MRTAVAEQDVAPSGVEAPPPAWISSHLAWIAFAVVGAFAAHLSGLPVREAGLAAAIALVPGMAGLLLGAQARQDWALWLAALVWTGFAFVASVGLGGLSTAAALFLVAPALAAHAGRPERAAAFAGLSALAFAASAIIGLASPDLPSGAGEAHLAVFAALAAILMVGVLLATARPEAAGTEARAPLMAAMPLTAAPASRTPRVSLDAEGRIRALDPSAQALFELTPEIAVGRPLGNFVRAEDRDALARAVLAARGDGRAEVVVSPMRVDGRRMALSVALEREREGDGLDARLHDVSVLEARLQEAVRERDVAREQAAMRADFVTDAAHELRTPLNAIIGFSDLLRSGAAGALNPAQADYVEIIHESGRSLADTVEATLDLSAIDRGGFDPQWEPTDLRLPVRAAMTLLRGRAQEAGVALVLSEDSAPVGLESDPRMLRQIAVNLVSNALKFAPEGGTVDVWVGMRGEHAVLEVSDTGPGVPSDVLDRLGTRGLQGEDERVRRRGSGLGLSIVQGFVRRLGGTFDLVNRSAVEPGGRRGAVATIRLPQRRR
jgi:signal transduction histidine kinase